MTGLTGALSVVVLVLHKRNMHLFPSAFGGTVRPRSGCAGVCSSGETVRREPHGRLATVPASVVVSLDLRSAPTRVVGCHA